MNMITAQSIIHTANFSIYGCVFSQKMEEQGIIHVFTLARICIKSVYDTESFVKTLHQIDWLQLTHLNKYARQGFR